MGDKYLESDPEREKLRTDKHRESQKEQGVNDSFLPDSEKEKDVKFKDKSCTKVWCVAAYVLIVSNIVLLIATLTVTVVWHIQRKNSLEGDKSEPDICLPCNKLSANWRGDKDVLDKFTVRNSTCCAKTSNHLDKLVKTYLENKRPFQRYAYTSYGCQSNKKEKPAIRVVGIYTVKNDILLWKEDSALSYKRGGLFYEDGHLHVHESGLYYAYSQVVLADEPSQTGVLHSVHKRSLNQTDHEKLLEGTHSSCQTQAKQSNLTSFIGAVFMFEAGDKVMTKLDQNTKRTDTDHHHHFGMYMI